MIQMIKKLVFIVYGHFLMAILVCNQIYFASHGVCTEKKFVALSFLVLGTFLYFFAKENVFHNWPDSILKNVSHLFAITSGYTSVPIVAFLLLLLAIVLCLLRAKYVRASK